MGLPTVAPGEIGLDARRLTVADGHVQAGLADETYLAATLVVARHGKIGHAKAFGKLQPEGGPTQIDSIFDLASVTKPNVATSLLTLVEDGKVHLGDRISEYVPETKGTALEPLTIRLLATHTSGLPAWKALYKILGGKPPMLADILATPLHHPANTKYTYSDLGYILIGEVVARASGMPLDQYAHSRVFAPLGMKDTGFLPARTKHERIASTAHCPMRPGKVLVGEVHDSNCHAYGGVSGHAGLFGTAPDLAILGSALSGNGEANRHRLMGIPTLRLARTNQTTPDIGGHSIGWFTPPNGMLPRGDILGDSIFGHTGFTGTMLVIDPTLDLSVVLLTNRVMSPSEANGIAKVRRKVLNAVASAVTK